MKAHLLRLFCMSAANLYAHVKEPALNYVRYVTRHLSAQSLTAFLWWEAHEAWQCDNIKRGAVHL